MDLGMFLLGLVRQPVKNAFFYDLDYCNTKSCVFWFSWLTSAGSYTGWLTAFRRSTSPSTQILGGQQPSCSCSDDRSGVFCYVVGCSPCTPVNQAPRSLKTVCSHQRWRPQRLFASPNEPHHRVPMLEWTSRLPADRSALGLPLHLMQTLLGDSWRLSRRLSFEATHFYFVLIALVEDFPNLHPSWSRMNLIRNKSRNHLPHLSPLRYTTTSDPRLWWRLHFVSTLSDHWAHTFQPRQMTQHTWPWIQQEQIASLTSSSHRLKYPEDSQENWL